MSVSVITLSSDEEEEEQVSSLHSNYTEVPVLKTKGNDVQTHPSTVRDKPVVEIIEVGPACQPKQSSSNIRMQKPCLPSHCIRNGVTISAVSQVPKSNRGSCEYSIQKTGGCGSNDFFSALGLEERGVTQSSSCEIIPESRLVRGLERDKDMVNKWEFVDISNLLARQKHGTDKTPGNEKDNVFSSFSASQEQTAANSSGHVDESVVMESSYKESDESVPSKSRMCESSVPSQTECDFTSKRKVSDIVQPSKRGRLADSQRPSGKKLFKKFLSFVESRLEESVSDKAKLVERLKKSFDDADPQYTDGKEFYSLVLSKVRSIKASGSLTYLHIEDVWKELKFRDTKSCYEESAGKGECSQQAAADGCCSPAQDDATSVAKSAEDEKRERIIAKLERLLQRIDRRIHQLQAKELSLDDLDDDDSSYVREDRLKKKFVKVWKLLCRVKKCSSHAGREIHKKYRYSGTVYKEINEKVEDLVNREKIFPSFCDIYEVVRTYCEESRLKMSPSQIQKLSQDIFSNVGNELKRRRELDDQDILASYLVGVPQVGDPAEEDESLKSLLDHSAEEGAKKIQEVIDHYADLQFELKEEPQDISEAQSSSSQEEEEDADRDEEVSNFSDDRDVSPVSEDVTDSRGSAAPKDDGTTSEAWPVSDFSEMQFADALSAESDCIVLSD